MLPVAARGEIHFGVRQRRLQLFELFGAEIVAAVPQPFELRHVDKRFKAFGGAAVDIGNVQVGERLAVLQRGDILALRPEHFKVGELLQLADGRDVIHVVFDDDEILEMRDVAEKVQARDVFMAEIKRLQVGAVFEHFQLL